MTRVTPAKDTAVPPIARRRVLQMATGLAGAAALPARAAPFPGTLTLARDLARRPYVPPSRTLPGAAEAMTYDQYRGIRFRQDRALWAGTGLPFQIAFFPRGFLYRDAVDIYEVVDGQAAPVPSGPEFFDYDDPAVRVPGAAGFAGFRIHAPINQPGAFDEFCVFLGASYFRAAARGQTYGLSARGLAIGTGRPTPEEFPLFRAFWIERPQPGADSLVVHALLDGPSVAGAFRFRIAPGAPTVIDVDSTLFPRVDVPDAGIAPLTSMYQFSAGDGDRPRHGDWRSGVHDSDSLSILTGQAETLYRPLANPAAVQASAFADTDPQAFGLMQRRHGFADFGDLEVLYGNRPSAWVEPRDGWGAGAVTLVEIPTDSEFNDNMVAFWRGAAPLQAGETYPFRYRLSWGRLPPQDAWLGRVDVMRTGAGAKPGLRVFVLDVAGSAVASLPAGAAPAVELGSSAGVLALGYSGPNAETGGWRISLDFDPAGAAFADLRCRLRDGRGALSETWLYRWTA